MMSPPPIALAQIRALMLLWLAAASVQSMEGRVSLKCPEDNANLEYKLSAVWFEEGSRRNRFFFQCMKFEFSRRKDKWATGGPVELSLGTDDLPQ